MPPTVPPLVCTGFDITHALRAYLELGHNIDEHFSRVREAAPEEDKEVLEIPYSYDKRLSDNLHTRLLVPTGAYTRDQHQSRTDKTPPEEEVKAMESFIECANRLLPDDAARKRGGLKLEDMHYTARYPRELEPPDIPFNTITSRKVLTRTDSRSDLQDAPRCASCLHWLRHHICIADLFELGHNIDVVRLSNEAFAVDEESTHESDSEIDKILHELDRETAMVLSLQRHFRRIREDAPADDIEVLEIPYSFERRLPDNWHTRLFIPTGAYTREQCKSGALKTPPEEDVEVIESFIECATLPDDTARARGGLKLGDLQYTVRSPRELKPPFHRETRRETRLPPRPVREFLKSVGSQS
ncbi:hypothetical protein C8T65DRAFT_792764 [Cerioporus squamosus]|nr:hypothetical protein C8T65DRAFT_792764 [Cerioporus squamosus]